MVGLGVPVKMVGWGIERAAPVRRAFTLVELLVVIAVIAILVALLIPAVQAAREAARRTQCSSNKRQVALATLGHVSAHDTLPSIVDPRFQRHGRGYGPYGLVGWRFTILPYLEEMSIFDALNDPQDWRFELKEPPSKPENRLDVSVFQCPSVPERPELHWGRFIGKRRNEAVLDVVHPPANMAPNRINNVALQRGSGWIGQHAGAWFGEKYHYREVRDRDYDDGPAHWKGAKLVRVTDGLSHTVLVAERAGGGGAPWIFVDYGRMVVPGFPPSINQNMVTGIFSFHNGAHVVMCDGSGRFLTEEIEPKILGAILVRDDGLTLPDEFR